MMGGRETLGKVASRSQRARSTACLAMAEEDFGWVRPS